MALTDADRLQIVSGLLVKHNVFQPTGLLNEPKYTQNFVPTKYLDVYETLSATDNLSFPAYSYVIE